MERRDLYQDDLTEERQVTPGQRDDVAHTQKLDPDVLASDGPGDQEADADDDDDDDDDDEESDDDESEDLDD